MGKYSLILSEIIQPKSGAKVYELQKNSNSLLIDFYETIKTEKDFKRDFNKAIKIIENKLDGYRLTKEKWRIIHSSEKAYSIYEAKSKRLRIYVVIDLLDDPVVVSGGKKTKQDQDIQRVVNHIKRFRDENNSESDT